MITMIKCICEFCGVEFEANIAEYNRFLNGRKKHMCCSRLCANRLIAKNNKGENNSKYNSVNKNCIYCGKDYVISKCASEKSKFCCRECKDEYRTKNALISINCNHCGKEFKVKQGEINAGFHKFCSKECRFDNIKVQAEKTCEICGINYTVYNNRAIKSSVVCSKKCQKEWLKIYSLRPEVKERLREQGTKAHLLMTNSFTTPEMIVKRYFEKINIKCIPQLVVNNKLTVDFYLPQYNCMFEVYGDYWHANPRKFGDSEDLKPLNGMQKRNKNRDIRRYKILTNKYNYNFYSMWEYNIHNNLEKSMKGFLEYIDAKIRRDYVS